jgi:hypothetical protein
MTQQQGLQRHVGGWGSHGLIGTLLWARAQAEDDERNARAEDLKKQANASFAGAS